MPPMEINPAREASPLRRRRRQAGLSAEALAYKAGVSRNTVYLIEGGYVPSSRILKKIARVLGCDVDDLRRETVS
jgi:transcriptional regulator with XRE-family HTH domain